MYIMLFCNIKVTVWGYRVGVQVGSTVITHRQLDPYEARIQAMSVVAACAKGLMYFQSEVRRLAYYIH